MKKTPSPSYGCVHLENLGKKGIDKVAAIGKGLFIVRMKKMKQRDHILEGAFSFLIGNYWIIKHGPLTWI